MKNDYYIGIDPGISGGLTCLDEMGNIIKKTVMPTIKIGTKNRIDVSALTQWIKDCAGEEDIRMIAIEIQRPMHKQGVTSTFTTGQGYGILEGIVAALDIPYDLVNPKHWQNEMFKGMPKGNTKESSKKVAQRLFPKENFKKSDKCTNLHDGLTDSSLIAEYTRRKIK